MTHYVFSTYTNPHTYLYLVTGDTVTVTEQGVWDSSGDVWYSDTGGVSLDIAGTVNASFISLSGNDTVRVEATGQVYLSAWDGILLGGNNYGGSLLLNAGYISAENGVAVVAIYGANLIVNTGTIAGLSGAILGYEVDGNFTKPGDTLVNYGQVSTVEVAVTLHGPTETLTNSGDIAAVNDSAVSVTGDLSQGVVVGTAQAITNSGTIQSQSATVIAVDLLSDASTFHLTNSGMITGPVDAIVSSGASVDTIVNSGTITGNIFLGAGDDVYDGRGGILNGSVAGGAGNDIYFTSAPALIIVEDAGGGDADQVDAATSFQLGDGVELLTLLGADDYNGTGNALANGLFGNTGNNILSGLDGNDTLFGEGGNDRMTGGTQNDLMYGGFENDTLFGGAGGDVLNGDSGNDVLNGGTGRDTMTGGTGLDTFVFTAVVQSGKTNSSADRITDFIHGDDRVNLASIDADSTSAGVNDAFTFIGTAGFHGVAGELRFGVAGGTAFVQMDVNGDGVADSIIRLFGVNALDASDFVL